MDNNIKYNTARSIPINRPDIPNLSFEKYSRGNDNIHDFEQGVLRELGGKGEFLMTSSGKMSLYLLFRELNLKGNIITAPLTCTMAFAPIIPSGLQLKFVDIDPFTFVLDEKEVEIAIDENTKAILAVHLGGFSADLIKLRKLADENNILLIEDCAQAFGSTYCDKKLGTFGHYSCFSFAKNMWLAGGGGLYSENTTVISTIRSYQKTLPEVTENLIKYRFERDTLESKRGIDIEADQEYYNKFYLTAKNANIGIDYTTYFEKPDVKSRPSGLQAAILLEQLKNIDKRNHKRICNANSVINELQEVLQFQLFKDGQSTYSKLYCMFKEPIPNKKVIQELVEMGIDAKHLTKSHGIHLQERFDIHPNFQEFKTSGILNQYKKVHDRIFALPISSASTQNEIRHIVSSIKIFAMRHWKEKAINHFNKEHLAKEENRSAGMWPNKEGQQIRFKALAEIAPLDGCSVLDVGCGLGDFYYFLRENNIVLKSYTGIEIHPEIVRLAKEKNPEVDILHLDILENQFSDNQFDYTFASGLFNFAIDDWFARTETILQELFRISKYGVSVNFLRWRDADMNPVSAYVKFEELAKLIGILTNNFCLRADYKKNDFTVYILKRQLNG